MEDHKMRNGCRIHSTQCQHLPVVFADGTQELSGFSSALQDLPTPTRMAGVAVHLDIERRSICWHGPSGDLFAEDPQDLEFECLDAGFEDDDEDYSDDDDDDDDYDDLDEPEEDDDYGDEEDDDEF